jgi:shikimate kinase
MNKNIILIGFMGSGKTTLGRYMAQELDYSLIDLDHYIEQRYHKTIPELFAEKGETGFREIEQRMLAETLDFERTILSTGGGAPCFFDNIQQMVNRAIVVFIDVAVEVLAYRLTHSKTVRPLIAGKTPEELNAFIEEALAKRRPYYEQAQITVHTALMDQDKAAFAHQIVQEIHAFHATQP